MIDASLFIKGLVMGFSIAAPVGPVGLLCIRRTLANGRLSGFVSGLGAATADGIYGLIAGLGLTILSVLLINQQFWLRLVGGAFLIFLGVRTFLARPATDAVQASHKGLLSDYLTTLFVTLTNPLTIIAFAAVFAGLGMVSSTRYYLSVISLVSGVFLGSAAWWLLLSAGVGVFKNRVTTKTMQWINRVSGVLITGFGIWAVWSIIKV